jgi:hydrogenase nickel incorporation protein HypA/HybF
MQPDESVQNLIDKAARLAGGQPIKTIRATLGELTGLTPDQVQAAFTRWRGDTPAADAELVLRLEPGRVVCLACDQDVPTHADDQACGACGSYRRRVVAGQLLAVEGVSVDRSPRATRRTPLPRAGETTAARVAAGRAALARLHTEGDWDG